MLVALIATPIATLFFLSSHTKLAFAPQPHDIGVSTWVAVRVSNPHGTRDLTAWIEQNGMKKMLMETKTPGRPVEILAGAGSRSGPALHGREQGGCRA